MKKYILAINLLALLILISSCQDIVDADNSILKTKKIVYKTVKQDQEKDVIMPLKVGNLWVYRVTDYNTDQTVSKIFYDSLLVQKDTIINGEKWFVVVNPSNKLTDPMYLTNTDKGLYFRRSEWGNESLLRAQYPLVNSTYYVGYQAFTHLFNDPDTHINDTMDCWANPSIITNYGTDYGTFNAYSYQTWWNLRKQKITFDPWFIENYIPNLGLVEVRNFENDLTNGTTLSRVAYLVYTNLKIGKTVKQSVFEIDFGTLDSGQTATKTINSLFENDSDQNWIIKLIEIDNDPSFTIVNPPVVPFTVAPGGTFRITVKFQPSAAGEFKSDLLFFIEDNTLFKVKLKGKCE